MVKLTCQNCKIEMDTIRKTKRFCSNKCKLAYHDSVSKLKDSVSPDTINYPIDTITDNVSDTIKKTDSGYEVFGKTQKEGKKGEPIYYCSTHGEHCKSYCETMCKDCHHIEKGGENGKCVYCQKVITEAEYGSNWQLIRCCYECADKIRKKEMISGL